MSEPAAPTITPAAPTASDSILRSRARQLRVARVSKWILLSAASLSVAVTIGIVVILGVETIDFLREVSLVEFLTGRVWTPLFSEPKFGILPLVAGTVVTTGIALAVALPLGTISAVYLSEFAPFVVREIIKPILEILSAVPTVVYGYFALTAITPAIRQVFPDLPGFNMLSAGIVMGIMIIPYVCSLSEDAMRAVPMLLREGSYALGGNRVITAFRVVIPAALSGICSAYILAISRAIGETMIVTIAAGTQPKFTFNPLESAATITAFIAQVSMGDQPHGSRGYQSIFAAGAMLFVMTLVFNFLGYWLRKRFREAY